VVALQRRTLEIRAAAPLFCNADFFAARAVAAIAPVILILILFFVVVLFVIEF
jgi:hypothetical protein